LKGVDLINLAQDRCSCERGNGRLGSTKGTEYLD